MSNGYVDAGQIALQTASGLQGMRQQRQQFDVIEEQRQAQRQAQVQKAQALQKGAELLQSDDSLAVAQWAIKNPELRENFTSAVALQDQFAARPRLSLSKDVLSGKVDAKTAYQSRVNEIESKGGDASKLKEAVNTMSDAELMKIAEKDLAMFDPKSYEAYSKSIGADDSFTLSEGQKRFTGVGEVIAEVPKTINQLDRDLKTGKDAFDKASKIRGEAEKVNKVFRDVEDSYGRIIAASEGAPTGASDMALIFNYMKMLDPGSTVREGEFATAKQTGGIPAYIVSAYNSARDGRMLTEKQRLNFLNQAKKQFSTAAKKNNKRMSDYERLGKRYGLDRGDIIISEDVEVEENQQPRIEAPANAVEYLRVNPQAAEQFKAKYGYLPEGF